MKLDLDAAAVSTAWLAASSVGLPTQADQRLNRTLIVEQYRDAEKHPAGLAFVGMSEDLVVVVSVPFLHGTVGTAGLFDLIVETDPEHVERWPVDDRNGLGKKIVQTMLKEATRARQDGATLGCSLMPTNSTPDALLDRPALALAAQGITEAAYVNLASYTPRDWREAMPGSDDSDPFIPSTAIQIEARRLYTRLNAVLAVVGPQDIEWVVHRLPGGQTVRYLKHETDDYTVEISAAIGLEPGATPVIWKVKPLDPLAETAEYPQDALDLDDLDDDEPIDPDAANVISRVFG